MVRKQYEKVNVLGSEFDNISMMETMKIVSDFMKNNTKENMFIVTANPEIVYYAKQNQDYMNIIRQANLIVPDGIGIIKAAKKLGRPLKERIPGIELMENILIEANHNYKRVFLLGASKETVNKCQKELQTLYPNIKFKSKHGYKSLKDYKRVEQVKRFNPDIVFVAMGYPKQETWIYYYQKYFEHTIFMGVGGSFDVFSGNIKRAPKIFINLNLEWLYRVLTDFSRLKRARIIPLFLWEIFIQKIEEKYYSQNDLK